MFLKMKKTKHMLDLLPPLFMLLSMLIKPPLPTTPMMLVLSIPQPL